jgi:hypothetical protein
MSFFGNFFGVLKGSATHGPPVIAINEKMLKLRSDQAVSIIAGFWQS